MGIDAERLGGPAPELTQGSGRSCRRMFVSEVGEQWIRGDEVAIRFGQREQ